MLLRAAVHTGEPDWREHVDCDLRCRADGRRVTAVLWTRAELTFRRIGSRRGEVVGDTSTWHGIGVHGKLIVRTCRIVLKGHVGVVCSRAEKRWLLDDGSVSRSRVCV